MVCDYKKLIMKVLTSLIISVNVNGYCSHEKRKNLDLEVNRMVWMDLEVMI
jgi:hypothetical protein